MDTGRAPPHGSGGRGLAGRPGPVASPGVADDLFHRFSPMMQRVGGPAGIEEDSGSEYRAAGAPAGAPRESEVLSAIERLPPLPTVVRRILDLVGSERGSTGDLEDLLRLDMALVAKLLKLVNSPFYGLSGKVHSIQQAVTMIGFAGVRSLVVAASVSGAMAQDLAPYGFTERGLWQNSIATAAMARAVAQVNGAGGEEAEDHFLCGLMRDAGMLVLGPFLAQRGLRLRRTDEPVDLLQRERVLIGFDHCWVGDRIGAVWRLPLFLRLALGRHHRAAIDPIQARMLAAIRLAERLAYASRIGVVPDHPFESRVEPTMIAEAGLDAPRFQQLMQRLPAVIQGAQTSL